MKLSPPRPDRRRFTRLALASGVALAAPRAFAAETFDPYDEVITDGPARITRRISGLSSQKWEDHFPTLGNGAILCNTNDRVLHFWGEDGFYKIYPTSVPLTDELTRRGRTEIVLKRPAPEWRPTPNMLERNPDLPKYVGPGPQNPLGVRALNLSWQYYLIHGTNDIRKIGRQSSSGCIGLFNEHIIEVFERAKIGTQVLLI
ncbi:L,D-transpeptidase [Amaricoccus macauensis]|uniref:L,D-transpeptidase n=1 Tax=Amaricoccus macauensis TaxID=57001 RepID=UPI003C7999C1